VVGLSAQTGLGFEFLELAVLSLFKAQPISREQDSFAVGRMRHSELLEGAVVAVEGALNKVERGECLPDLLSADLRAALSCLGEISGEVSSEDVLNFIFSEFCIGK
jgi:tRNA modification GTPase